MLYESIMCLTILIYFEARSEDVTGQESVANVVMERYKSREWRGDICELMLQPAQFSFIDEVDIKVTVLYGFADKKAGAIAERAATIIYKGEQPNLLFPNATCYTKVAIQRSWMEGLDFGVYGRHKFADCSRKGRLLKKQREKRLIELGAKQ